MLCGKEWMNFHFEVYEERNFSFLVFYLTMVPVFRLCIVNERMINECGAISEIRILRGNQSKCKKGIFVPVFNELNTTP
jgi:hypothetical protein